MKTRPLENRRSRHEHRERERESESKRLVLTRIKQHIQGSWVSWRIPDAYRTSDKLGSFERGRDAGADVAGHGEGEGRRGGAREGGISQGISGISPRGGLVNCSVGLAAEDEVAARTVAGPAQASAETDRGRGLRTNHGRVTDLRRLTRHRLVALATNVRAYPCTPLQIFSSVLDTHVTGSGEERRADLDRFVLLASFPPSR